MLVKRAAVGMFGVLAFAWPAGHNNLHLLCSVTAK